MCHQCFQHPSKCVNWHQNIYVKNTRVQHIIFVLSTTSCTRRACIGSLLNNPLTTDICDYNPKCLMPSGLMFHDIITNKFRNKSENQHLEVVDSYFTKTEDKHVSCTEGHFKMFIGRKLLMKVLMFYVHFTMSLGVPTKIWVIFYIRVVPMKINEFYSTLNCMRWKSVFEWY